MNNINEKEKQKQNDLENHNIVHLALIKETYTENKDSYIYSLKKKLGKRSTHLESLFLNEQIHVFQ